MYSIFFPALHPASRIHIVKCVRSVRPYSSTLPRNFPSTFLTSSLKSSTSFQQSNGRLSFSRKQLTIDCFAFSIAFPSSPLTASSRSFRAESLLLRLSISACTDARLSLETWGDSVRKAWSGTPAKVGKSDSRGSRALGWDTWCGWCVWILDWRFRYSLLNVLDGLVGLCVQPLELLMYSDLDVCLLIRDSGSVGLDCTFKISGCRDQGLSCIEDLPSLRKGFSVPRDYPAIY